MLKPVLTVAILILLTMTPFIFFFMGKRTVKRFKRSLGVNVIAFFGMLLLVTFSILSGNIYASSIVPEAAAQAAGMSEGLKYIAAAISVGAGSIGCGIAVSASASAAIGAISENENVFGKTLVYVGLAEGVAIYGLLIALMILFA